MDAYLGEIRLFAGNFAPIYWEFCLGQSLPINQYSALFSLLGYTYGGTQNVNFNLPDLRGRVPIGTGNGPGLTPRALGTASGTTNVTLTNSQMPVHTHSIKGKASAGTTATNDPTNSTWTNVAMANKIYAPTFNVAMNAQAVTPAIGGGQAHNNVQPCVGINYIICVQEGYYPDFE